MKVWIGIAKEGRPSYSEEVAHRFRLWLQDNPGKKFRTEPIDGKEYRSMSQNRFYHLYLDVIAAETGDDSKSLHEGFIRELLPAQFIKFLGKDLRVPGSTKRLTKSEFSDYLERICALTLVPIPDVKLLGYDNTYKSIKPMDNYPEEELGEQIL